MMHLVVKGIRAENLPELPAVATVAKIKVEKTPKERWDMGLHCQHNPCKKFRTVAKVPLSEDQLRRGYNGQGFYFFDPVHVIEIPKDKLKVGESVLQIKLKSGKRTFAKESMEVGHMNKVRNLLMYYLPSRPRRRRP